METPVSRDKKARATVICAVHQPNFLPWRGFFEKARAADLFVLLDDVQFSKGSLTNRQKTRGRNGDKWLTVPVTVHGPTLIKDVRLAARFRMPWGLVWDGELVAEKGSLLVDLTIPLIKQMATVLEIRTPFVLASALRATATPGAAGLLEICRAVGATAYLSGPSGVKYGVPETFVGSGIEVVPFVASKVVSA